MSQYFKKGKGWRYDFTLNGMRYTEAWFKTKKEAKDAEHKKKEELKETRVVAIETDMGFLDLVRMRLNHVRAYKSNEYYKAYYYMAVRWLDQWGELGCRDITVQMIEDFLIERAKKSEFAANKDLRHIRATFNFGKKRKFILNDPTAGVSFFPIEKRIKYVPSVEDIDRVISCAAPDVQDYLWTICDTMARVDEINRLTWDDVFFEGTGGHVVLYTRKKRGGNLTPRKVPMTKRLYGILARRSASRNQSQPWVFCNTYYDGKAKMFKTSAFGYRKTIMKTLCERAGVKRFSYHSLRHSGASIMANENVPIGAIQNILGHENRTTTEIYLHSIGNTEKDAISAYEKATAGNRTETNSHTESHTVTKRAGNR